MPLARYQIRNEYSLSDPELYRAADKDDPEALLEGVAMAGLVGVLRQLGDLAQFAAEIFHDLHEEVMATAARGHGLMARVQQLEAEVPSLEKAFLSQTHHSSFFSNGGTDWHPNLRSEQNLITREDLPRFVMDSYEDCRGPPRLFLLDKFDVAGAGACLKRYTDPSFFKLESASSTTETAEIHWEKRSRRVKQKKAARLRNGETPEVVPTHAKLHQLLLEERIENAYSNPARLVKLKKRQLNGPGIEAKTGKSYMEKFLESPSPDYKMVCETSIIPLPVKSMSEDTSEAGIKILEINTVSPVKRSLGTESTHSSPNEQESVAKSSSETEMETKDGLMKLHEQMPASVRGELSYNNMKAPDETELADDGQKKLETCLDGYHSDDATSEVDNYMDALTTMESEMETDNECRPKKSFLKSQRLSDSDGKEEHQLEARYSYSQSFGDSSTSDESSSFKQVRNDEPNELRAGLSDSQSIGTTSTMEENSSFKRETSEDHMELHAQFSDSQSAGNSSASEEISVNKKDTSSFSQSDSSGIMVENIKSEPLLLSSTRCCEYEIEDTPSNHLTEIVEPQKPDCNKFVMHDDAESQEEEISDSGRSYSCLIKSGHMISCSDLRANSPVIQSTETQLVETTSDTVELHSNLVDEDRKCLPEPTAVVPDALSIVEDDACPVSPEKYPSNNLDDGDPYFQSGASLQISNYLKLAPEIIPSGTQLVERPSDPVELHSSLADDSERKCDVESVAAVPDAPSILKYDACPVSSSEKYPSNNLDDGDPYGHSDASLQISNELELAAVVIPAGNQLVEAPSEPVELHSSLVDDEERKCHVESIAAAPNAFSVTKDDACSVVSSEEYPLNNLDYSDPYVHSNASLQISNDLNVAPVDECSDHSEINVLQAGFSNENSVEILPGREVSSSGEHPVCPFMEEVDLYSGTTLPLDGAEVLDSKAEDCIIASKLNSEDSSPAVETPPASSLTREQLSYFTHESPKDEPNSAGVEVLYSDQLSNFEEITRMEHGDEKIRSACSMDAVEEDGHLQQPSSPGYVGQGDHVNVNDVFTEKIQSEDQAASADCVDSAKSSASIVICPTSDLISSSSRNLADLLEPLPGSLDSYQSEMESNKAESTEIFRDLDAETRKNQLEPSSDTIASNIVSYSTRGSTNLEESLSSFIDTHSNEMEFSVAVARESFTELEAQRLVDQPEVSSADVGLSLNRLVSHDLSDSETSNSIQYSSPKVKSQHISSANDANDVMMLSELSELGTQKLESSSCHNNSLPSPSYNQLELETLSQLQSQAGQQDADFPPRAEENSASQKFQSEHMHVSNQLEQERKSLAASESSLEMRLDQLSSFESSSQSAGQEMYATKHVMDSLKPLNPFSQVSEINLGEMPPMPPLPPMQWRRGKVQHASQREAIEVSQASFQPIQPIKTDEKGQFGLLTSEREYQNPFLPVMPVESDKNQYSSGFSVGVSGQPVAVPLQFPFMVNEANGQYNYLFLERSQNPFLTLPVVSTGRPPHGYFVASEGEMVQYSNPCPPMPLVDCAVPGYDPVSSHEKLTQPASQQMAETASEVKEAKHSLSNVEGEQEDPSVTPVPPPSTEIVQDNHSLSPSEGELASFDISALTSEFEGEKANGTSKNKLPRPRNPLIDAVAAHDKSKLRKVTQRARPETAPNLDERDSLLEQIRTKSFNLKPAMATRPSIQGPKTNLKVAAILEKANAIRQALAGSDDEDDADGWSDS